MIPAVVYSLCTVTSTFCALVLLLQYRKTRVSLLFWSGVCFVGFALNNALLIADYIIPNEVADLSVVRTIPALVGLTVMLIAFIRETI